MTMISRRLFLASGAVAGSGALMSTAATRSDIRREVLAFYYPWFGTRSVSGAWRHWQAPDGTSHDQDPTVDHPVGGPYDSHDPAVLQRHANELVVAGITGILSSWTAPDEFKDQILGKILDTMHARGLRVSVYIEPRQRDAASAQSDIAYLLRKYAAHPAWLRVDGHPVLFVYYASIQQFPAAGWRAAADAAATATRETRPILIGDVSPRQTYYPQRAASFDGTHVYTMAPMVMGMTPAQIDAYTAKVYPDWQRNAPPIRCATVIPGFDDRIVPGRPLPRPVVERYGTGTFDALWRAAMASNVDWVLISSFNEWHEGSEIEPSREYGDTFLRRNKLWSNAFLAHRPIPVPPESPIPFNPTR